MSAPPGAEIFSSSHGSQLTGTRNPNLAIRWYSVRSCIDIGASARCCNSTDNPPQWLAYQPREKLTTFPGAPLAILVVARVEIDPLTARIVAPCFMVPMKEPENL